MTNINGMYVFFGLFVVVIIGLWVTGNLFKTSKKSEFSDEELKSHFQGGKRKRKPRRKQRLR